MTDTMFNLREIREEDAASFVELCLRLDEETRFMMLEPGERRTSVEEVREKIGRVLLSDNQTTLVAEAGGGLAGYLSAEGGEFRRNRHCAQIVVGVLRAYAGRGVGTLLFTEMERWAARQGVSRLELTVMTHNERAVALYRRMGFEVEGRRRNSLLVGGAYVDEYYMAKLLRDAGGSG